jgi:plastocyanin
LTYNNTTGVFAYTPPDLSTYLTAITSSDVTTALGYTPLQTEANDLSSAVTWANIPDANVPESAVTQHAGALSITESQISDLGTYLTSVGVLSNHTDVSATTPNTGQVLKWDGAQWAPAADLTGAGGGGIALTDLSVTQNAASGAGTLTYNNTSGAFTYTPPDLSNYATLASFSVGAPGAASGTGSISYNNSTGVFTYTPPKVQIEVLPAITQLVVTANGSSAYRFDQYGTTDNPSVYAISGTTIAFDLSGAAGHPFLVQTSGGTNYDTGLIHIDTDNTETTGSAAQGKTSGVLYWKIPIGTTGSYQYQCSVHGAMVGSIIIKDFVTL